MCAMPANSFPRSSPECPFVSTQTQYLPNVVERCSIVIAGALTQPLRVYDLPSLTKTTPFDPTWIDEAVALVVGRSNVQQSLPCLALTWMLTTPCSPMPESFAPSSGCIPAPHAIGTVAARAAMTAAGSASALNAASLVDEIDRRPRPEPGAITNC